MSGIIDPAVAKVINGYPPAIRRKVLRLRTLILKTAAAIDGIGGIVETLKWGEAAYLPKLPRIGSTVRIAWKKSKPKQYAVYFHCQTRLIETFRTLYPADFTFEGNRAIVFDMDDAVPTKALSSCIAEALTYHRRKR